MITLAFLLDHQVISRSDKNTVVAGSKNYVRARFILRTDDWVRPITAIFGGYTQLLDDNNECTVPWEVLQQPGNVEVSAFCGDLHTANIAVVPVEKTGYKSGETPKDPTPDVYDQLAKMVQEAVDTANSVREDADAGDFDGEQGPAGPQGEPGLGVPQPTLADAGRIPVVNAEGTGYVLREVSAGGGGAGQPGTDGEDGGYYKPSLDSAGNLSWQASKPGMPDVPEANIRGPQGPQGEPGTDGKDGEQGPAGTPGADGTTPTIGPNGNWYLGEIDTGKSSRGEQGPQGENGGYYMPSVDTAGNLSWTPSKVGMPSVPEANIRGPEGPQGGPGPQGEPGAPGQDGQPGAAATITVGTVTTLEPGQPATVTNAGTESAAVLNFGIPKGASGSTGLPTPTATDANKMVVVNADGTGYILIDQPVSGIVMTITGNPAALADSIGGQKLRGLKIYGKTTQAGTPGGSYLPLASPGTGGSILVTVSDGNTQSQQLTAGMPAGGLPGIPVASGGTVTIGGQQYAANIRDYGAGLDTIAVGRIVLDGTEEWAIQSGEMATVIANAEEPYDYTKAYGLCSHYGYGPSISAPGVYVMVYGGNILVVCNSALTAAYSSNSQMWKTFLQTQSSQGHPVEVLYRLAEPYTQAIPAEELAAYLALTTYEGATVVSTSEPVAGLEVKYLADGEKYVERIVSQKASEAAAAHTMALLADGIREGVNGV